MAQKLVPNKTVTFDNPKRIAFNELIRKLQSQNPICQAAAERA